MKILSEYYGKDIDRKAQVYLEENFYKVRVRNETGSYFVAGFNNLDEAENFAENYVLVGEPYEP